MEAMEDIMDKFAATEENFTTGDGPTEDIATPLSLLTKITSLTGMTQFSMPIELLLIANSTSST